MNSVFVVEQGNYSDYHVVGVFSTKENADMICGKINLGEEEDSYGKASVAEWPLNPGVSELNQGLKLYNVGMRADGTVVRAPYADSDIGYGLRNAGFHINRGEMWGTVWAESDIHAIKIANELRGQGLAEGRFV